MSANPYNVRLKEIERALDELPRNAMGKVHKNVLRERYGVPPKR